MNELGRRIKALIETEGPMSVAQFMTLCQYDPKGGTYSARDPLGASGDYVTAPEISQSFGELLGLWVVQSWHNQGQPAHPVLVELGPGRGTLMSDALRAIHAALPKFFAGGEVFLVEANPVLAEIQQKKLADAPGGPRWLPRLADLPAGGPVYVVANEFFDCLPIHQFVKTAEGWREKLVAAEGDRLILGLSSAIVPEALLPAAAKGAAVNAVYETSPAAAALVGEIGAVLAARGGSALIVDYGYDKPEFHETLQAVQHHKHADVLAMPGESDLSAHVDFPALRTAAEKAGIAAFGPVGQGDFLVSLGIDVRAERLMMANPNQAKVVLSGIRRLIDPAQMGALFKAFALTPTGAAKPPGF
jgi:NADH dehydrogenase [ubiquinone] 1 alpha subcomplex assembly factor 7